MFGYLISYCSAACFSRWSLVRKLLFLEPSVQSCFGCATFVANKGSLSWRDSYFGTFDGSSRFGYCSGKSFVAGTYLKWFWIGRLSPVPCFCRWSCWVSFWAFRQALGWSPAASVCSLGWRSRPWRSFSWRPLQTLRIFRPQYLCRVPTSTSSGWRWQSQSSSSRSFRWWNEDHSTPRWCLFGWIAEAKSEWQR